MKLPRDISGIGLSKRLKTFGYELTRQSGSHLRLTSYKKGEHHITIPNHDTKDWYSFSNPFGNFSSFFHNKGGDNKRTLLIYFCKLSIATLIIAAAAFP